MPIEMEKVDPILVSVLDSRFSSIVAEMAISMARTSRSPIFFEARDCVTAIFTRDLRLITQKDFIPVLAGAIPIALKHIAKSYEGDIHEGDVFVHNDAYTGGNHLPDTNIAKPIFHEGELVFWAITKGHLAEIGGRGIAGYDPSATTIWDDGLVIPTCKLYDGGKYNRSVWDLIGRNSKVPELVLGDIACEVGAVTLAERRFIELIERYTVQTLYAAIDQIISATEKEIRERIRLIPDGVYYGEKSIDHDSINRDKPVTVRIKITKEEDEITVDYSDSDPQVQGYVNSTWANTYSISYLPIFYILPGGDVKRNEGSLRPIKIIAPEGTWVNPRFPAPVTLCTVATSQCIAEAIWLALSRAGRQYTVAAHSKLVDDCVLGYNPRTKRMFAGIDFSNNTLGGGGREGYDGWPAEGSASSLGQVRYPDFEMMELTWPIRYLQHEQVMDSEAAGQYIGSWAYIYRLQYLANCSAVLMGHGMRDFSSPFGLFGGAGAKPHRFTIHKGNSEVQNIDCNTSFEYKAGDWKEHYIQEGGGFGNPYERDPALVQKNVRDELVSVERAKKSYGVIINAATLEIDSEATKGLRTASRQPTGVKCSDRNSPKSW